MGWEGRSGTGKGKKWNREEGEREIRKKDLN